MTRVGITFMGLVWLVQLMPSVWLSIVSVPLCMGKDRRILNYDALVIRIKKDGTYGDSRPCYHCLYQMKKSKLFRYCYYSTSDGSIIRERVSEMVTTHVCTGMRTAKFS